MELLLMSRCVREAVVRCVVACRREGTSVDNLQQ